MFSFFKKKSHSKTDIPKAKPELSTAQKEVLRAKIKTEKDMIEQQPESELTLARSYEQIGLCYAELNEIDQAIAYLEKSLRQKASMGSGYKKLMSLYNRKRAEAAHQKDNESIDYYMRKIDEMRNIAKNLTLSRNAKKEM